MNGLEIQIEPIQLYFGVHAAYHVRNSVLCLFHKLLKVLIKLEELAIKTTGALMLG